MFESDKIKYLILLKAEYDHISYLMRKKFILFLHNIYRINISLFSQYVKNINYRKRCQSFIIKYAIL